MNKSHDEESGPLQRREQANGSDAPETIISAPEARQPAAAGQPLNRKINPWVFADILFQKWHWLVLGFLVGGSVFFLLGYSAIKSKFTAIGQLLRYETPGASDFFKTTQITAETFSGMIKSPELLRQVGATATPPIPPEKFVKQIKIEPEPDSDLIKISLASRDQKQAVALLNTYMQEAVKYTRDLQSQQAARLANNYLQHQVTQIERDIQVLENQFRNLPVIPQVTNKLAEIGGNIEAINQNLTNAAAPAAARPGARPTVLLSRQAERLQVAMGELNDLLLRYTEIHPSVQAKRQQIESLQSQFASAATNKSANLPIGIENLGRPGEFNPEIDIIRTRLLAIEDGRVQLATRQREAELFAKDPPGIARVFAPATPQTVETNMRGVKIGAVTIFGGLLGMLASLALLALVEFMDNRIKSAEDVKRVTQLPVLTSLGDLHKMNPAERSQWAFRTWTLLQGQLSPSPNHGLVCGVTSSKSGEGRSTWISLLAEAASMAGFRVLTIATKPSPTHVAATDGEDGEDFLTKDPDMNGSEHSSSALTSNVLTSPAKVAEQLVGPNSQPVVHIPLPGWVWNLERRKQWREALSHWRGIDNLVILVELPPANISESVLLGSNLPNLLWLTECGGANARATRAQIATLRHARCNLVGAVVNRENSTPLKERFPRWIPCLIGALLVGLSSLSSASAQTNALPPAGPSAQTNAITRSGSGTILIQTNPAPRTGITLAQTNNATATTAAAPRKIQAVPHFSVSDPSQRAAWQERLTLGSGDVLNFGLYGAPELHRAEVVIPPDGRVSYLEAQDVVATGKTIDELRIAFDEQLSKFRRAPRTIITPVSFRSKKYFMLGKVMTKGVFTLERPITVLEAVARARGFESGLVDRNVIDLADFQRAFLARGGKRIPLNFEKLFQEGDLSQNIPIEPNDYIYFPSTNVREVFVVGEVRLPGPVIYRKGMSIIEAIAARGGYTERAYKLKVAVVRGSLNNPETHVVNTHAILDGKALNFALEPKDIIFVNSRPLILVEEWADLAATAFIQSFITTWVGVDVVKPVN